MLIEVFQDTICPWCRIGIKQLDDALEQWEGEKVTVQYRTFFLNPSIPAEGFSFDEYWEAKGSEIPNFDEFIKPIQSAAQTAGLDFNFTGLEKVPNTILSHKILHLVPEAQRGDLLRKLHTSYFQNGGDIGNMEVLLHLIKEMGLNPDQIKDQIDNDGGKEEAFMDFYYAIQIGIRGVPFFIFDNKAVLNGLQSTSTILETMEKVAQKEDIVEEMIEE